MTLPTDRRIATRFGPLKVHVRAGAGGRVWARLAAPDEHPRLTAVTMAFGADEDEAVERLRAGIERFGADPPAQPRRRRHRHHRPALLLGDHQRHVIGRSMTSRDRAPRGSGWEAVQRSLAADAEAVL